MSKMRPLNLLIVTVSAVALAACTSWLGSEKLKVTPVNKMSGLTGDPRDPLYETAVTAINERDYGRALDYLQEAKARNPSNLKVLNALGVVYDKLGRFDLSARYYAQARAIDPNSRVLAANVSYSNALQGLTDPNARGPVAQLDLPENFNPGPPGKPTVLASAPAANAVIQSPARPVSPPVVPPALAHTEIADSFKPSPKPVEAAPVSLYAPKQIAWAPPAIPQAVEPTAASIAALPAAAVVKPLPKQVEAAPVSLYAPKQIAWATPVFPQAVALPTASIAALPAAAVIKPAPKLVEAAPVSLRAPRQIAWAPPAIPQAVEPPAASIAALPAAAVVKPLPKQVEAAPVSLHAPKQIAWAPPAIPQAVEPPAASITALPAAAAKPVVKLAVSVTRKVPAETPRIDAVSKPRIAAAVPPKIQSSKPAGQPRIASLPAVPAVAQPLPLRVAALPVKKKLFIIGQPVRIMNASGKPDRVGTVSRRLSSLGWTVRLAEAGRTQAVTTLVYNKRYIGAAKAMQRTLPFPVRLVAESGTTGMRLVVGRDYLSWKSKNARLHALWQKGPIVASLKTETPKGVR